MLMRIIPISNTVPAKLESLALTLFRRLSR
jgi:hypothetical protein